MEQWGQAKAIGSVRTKEFAITFPSECNIAMALPWNYSYRGRDLLHRVR